jgi:hypothetical protein
MPPMRKRGLRERERERPNTGSERERETPDAPPDRRRRGRQWQGGGRLLGLDLLVRGRGKGDNFASLIFLMHDSSPAS